eukprot:NODE_364_length_1582_cov_109.232877_g271_i0.p1 GENE.NODE_364_length_1582_cov_109.232877_g271_i0~~NODE_364_length_1582_cov_109.232877_g271_i0.p1  ORF type:complete len:409 (-),score=67.37 NODE_364_length_1582_cov_109.232877_g271_i0:291-1517(-)
MMAIISFVAAAVLAVAVSEPLVHAETDGESILVEDVEMDLPARKHDQWADSEPAAPKSKNSKSRRGTGFIFPTAPGEIHQGSTKTEASKAERKKPKKLLTVKDLLTHLNDVSHRARQLSNDTADYNKALLHDGDRVNLLNDSAQRLLSEAYQYYGQATVMDKNLTLEDKAKVKEIASDFLGHIKVIRNAQKRIVDQHQLHAMFIGKAVEVLSAARGDEHSKLLMLSRRLLRRGQLATSENLREMEAAMRVIRQSALWLGVTPREAGLSAVLLGAAVLLAATTVAVSAVYSAGVKSKATLQRINRARKTFQRSWLAPIFGFVISGATVVPVIRPETWPLLSGRHHLTWLAIFAVNAAFWSVVLQVLYGGVYARTIRRPLQGQSVDRKADDELRRKRLDRLDRSPGTPDN